MTANYQENPLKDWFHRRCALTILCLILGEWALFSRAIAMVPRHGQEVCWVPKYGLSSTETKRGGGGSIRTMTRKGKVLPEPRRLPPADTCCWGEGPSCEDWSLPSLHSPALSNSVGIQVRAGRFAIGILFFLTRWAHVAKVGDTGEPSAACNIHQHDKFDGDQ